MVTTARTQKRYDRRLRELVRTTQDIRFALTTDRKIIVAQCPLVVVHFLLLLQGAVDLLMPADLLYLGRWCEQNAAAEQALWMYATLRMRHAGSREVEMALVRTAGIHWRIRNDADQALAEIDTLLTTFPTGAMVFEAEDLRDEILQVINRRLAA